MKTKSKFTFILKAFTLLLLAAFFSSCKEEESPVGDIDTEEIAEIVGATLAEDSQGMTAQLKASAELSQETDTLDMNGNNARVEESDICGQEFDDSFTLISPDNYAIAYNYSFSYLYGFACNQFFVPNSLNFSIEQSGELEAPRYGAINESKGNWIVSGLELSSTQYTFQGNYVRSGNHASKVGNQNSFNYELATSFSELKMNKGNYVISQGTGSISINGTSSVNGSFSFNGSIEFLGNQQILLTINQESYIIDIQTGEVYPV